VGVGILIGYFPKHDEARKAVLELAKQDFRRAVLVHKAANGDVHITDIFRWRRAYGMTMIAILCGGLAGVVSFVLRWLGLLPRGIFFTPILFLSAIIIGGLPALLWLRRSRYGIEPEVMRDHIRRLMPGESVLILQAPVEALHHPVTLLLENTDIPPALFVMHPKRERRTEARVSSVRLSPAGEETPICSP